MTDSEATAMTVKELNVGDVFHVVGEKVQWRKASERLARRLGSLAGVPLSERAAELKTFNDKKLVVVERAPEIGRAGNTLILRGGEVTLEYRGALLVCRYTPGEPFTELALGGPSYPASFAQHPTEETALMFVVGAGSAHLGRGKGSELFAYDGRIYVRATHKEVTGQHKPYGYKRVLKIDGARRMIVMGLSCIPNEFSLYDIMMEHFGPDTVPRG